LQNRTCLLPRRTRDETANKDAEPPAKAKPVKAKPRAAKPANGNGAVQPAPAAAPAKAATRHDGAKQHDYREELAASLKREALLAGMYARELRRKA
jgi:hypothetical protein